MTAAKLLQQYIDKKRAQAKVGKPSEVSTGKLPAQTAGTANAGK
jgi:hypothetical protein